MLISASSGPSKKMLQLADFHLHLFTFLQVSHRLGNERFFQSSPWRARVFHFHFGGSLGEPGQVAVCCKAFLLVAALCFSWMSDTSFGGRSFKIHLCLTLPSQRKRSAAQQVRSPNQRKQPRNPHSHPRKEQSPQAQQEAKQAHTHRKFRGIPNTLHLRNGTEDLKHFAGQTIQTDSFTADLNPLPFSPPPPTTSLFPLLLSSSLASLIHFCSSTVSPSTSSRSQRLREFSWCIALYSRS